MKGYYVYKYIDPETDNIVYIGLSKNISSRINDHTHFEGLDKKFDKYPNALVFCHKCANEAEMKGLEKLLINQYKPELNVVDNYETTSGLTVDGLSWIPFDEIKRKEKEEYEKKEDLRQIAGLVSAAKKQATIFESELKKVNFAGIDKEIQYRHVIGSIDKIFDDIEKIKEQSKIQKDVLKYIETHQIEKEPIVERVQEAYNAYKIKCYGTSDIE